MHRDGQLRSDVDEMQVEQLTMGRVCERSDILKSHGWNNSVGISWNDQLDRMIGIGTHSHFVAVGSEQGQGYRSGEIGVGLVPSCASDGQRLHHRLENTTIDAGNEKGERDGMKRTRSEIDEPSVTLMWMVCGS